MSENRDPRQALEGRLLIPPPKEERRSATRQALVSAEVLRLFCACDRPHQQVQVYNLSAGGVAFQADERLKPGEDLCLRLPLANGKVLNILAAVVYATPQPEGQWRVGCKFSQYLAPDLMKALCS